MSHQQTDKHGPAVDDALQNARRQSSGGTHHRDRPEESARREPEDPVRLRSDLARFLSPSAFPGTAYDLLMVARDNNATTEVDRLLQSAPDRVYRTVEEVWEALFGPID